LLAAMAPAAEALASPLVVDVVRWLRSLLSVLVVFTERLLLS